MAETEFNSKWRQIVEECGVLPVVKAGKCFEISAETIKKYREPRLMAKIDNRLQLPEVFAEHSISILANSRRSYLLGCFDAFCNFDNSVDDTLHYVSPAAGLESLDYRNIKSEAAAIACASITGMLQDFTGETDLVATVSGRMGTGAFEFTISGQGGTMEVQADKVQIEIDGGFECANSLILVEAKNVIAGDFNIRQLYYPYREWTSRVGKPVRNLFLTYSNGIFQIREYVFNEKENYNSIREVKQKKYAIRDRIIDRDLLLEILDETSVVPEPKVPFPQANRFLRVVNLCELLNDNGFISKEDVAIKYAFDVRQSDYYINCGRYLGIIEVVRQNGVIGCVLTKEGKRLMSLLPSDREIMLLHLILAHEPFNRALRFWLDNARVPDEKESVEIMKGCNLYGIGSENTFGRRAGSMIGWVKWMASLVGSGQPELF